MRSRGSIFILNMKEKPMIGDIFGELAGKVPLGLMNRVAQFGGEIPDYGPGKYSIPNALKTPTRNAVSSQTLEGRRQHNRSIYRRS
jgi:hypothetical protein